MKESVTSLLALLGKVDLILTDSEWGVISNVIVVLTLFEEATIEISSESFPSISKVQTLSKIWRRHLVQVDFGGFSDVANELREVLLKKVHCRFISLGQVTPVVIATYLDPCFKKMYISPDDLLQVETIFANEIDFALLAAESRYKYHRSPCVAVMPVSSQFVGFTR